MRKTIPTLVLVAMCAAPAAAAPPTLTLKAAPTVVAYGGSTTLTGVLSTKKAGQAIDIQGQDCGQNAFKKVATATTTTGGAFSSAVKPTLNTNYQAKNKGATSPMVAVKVTPLLSLQKLSLGKFKVSVTAAQSFVGKYVVFQRLGNTKWVTLKKDAGDRRDDDGADAGHLVDVQDQTARKAACALDPAGNSGRHLLPPGQEQGHQELVA